MPKVSISGTEKVFEINEGEVLFDALADQGHELPHGCLSGSCGACRIEVLEGKESLDQPSRIEEDTVSSLRQQYQTSQDREIRLSCRAKVHGDVCIKPLD